MRYRFSSEDQLEATMFPFSIKFVPTTFVICKTFYFYFYSFEFYQFK